MNYIKHKQKNLNHKNSSIIGGNKNIKLLIKKIKMIEYTNENIYYLNNMDADKLDEFSEFPIGSVTKLFTIVSLLILHENKKIDVYDNIGKYIDNDEIKNLKIINIMNHTSGLKNFWNGATYGSSEIKYNNAIEIYNKWNDNNLFDPKLYGKFHYSNIGYLLLGVIIEKITNMTYSAFVKQNILIPLKMNNTGIEDCNIKLYNYKQEEISEYEKWERTFASADGELKSCINDLIKFSEFTTLLNDNTLNIMKELWIFYEDEDIYEIQHGGHIVGGKTKFLLTYNKKWQIKDIYILLETIK
jgi:CubicO group peptidase (beta-lactamase class C family)